MGSNLTFGDLPARRGMSAWLRVPGKMFIFAVVLGGVLFPHPTLLKKHLDHVRHLNRMIEPNAPELADFEKELRAFTAKRDKDGRESAAGKRGSRTRGGIVTPTSAVASAATPELKRLGEIQEDVEAFVLQKVKYDWDWNIWGMADYMPTVSEMFAKAKEYSDGQIREDCDGRAVMAASLLKRLGYDPRIVTDFGHVWVTAKIGGKQVELMGPGHVKAVVSTPTGDQINLTWAMLKNIPVAMGYGISVFPWLREFILYVAAVGLLWHRRMTWRASGAGSMFMLAGWQLIRTNTDYWDGRSVSFWSGLGFVMLGAVIMMAASRKARRESREAYDTTQLGM